MNFEEARKTLGINGRLTPEVIQHAFRKMAQQYHPDRYQTLTQQAWATRKFIKIKEARDLLNVIASDDINKNIFQEEDSFHENTKPTATTLKDLNDLLKSMDYGDGPKEVDGNRVEHSVASFPLFSFLGFLFEWSQRRKNIFFREIFYILIVIPVCIVFIPLFVYYFIVIFVLAGIFAASGIDAYSNSRTKRGRFAYLLIITLASAPFLILPWYYFMYHYGDFQQIINYVPRLCALVFLFGAIYLSLLSEWISFFLVDICRRSVQDDLQILPVIKQK